MKKIDHNKLNRILRIILYVLLVLSVLLGAYKYAKSRNDLKEGIIYENN